MKIVVGDGVLENSLAIFLPIFRTRIKLWTYGRFSFHMGKSRTFSYPLEEARMVGDLAL